MNVVFNLRDNMRGDLRWAAPLRDCRVVGEWARVVSHQRQPLTGPVATGMRNDDFDGAERWLLVVVVIVVQCYTRSVVVRGKLRTSAAYRGWAR
jgi:hypothetical protein